jgi:hypothetical protein
MSTISLIFAFIVSFQYGNKSGGGLLVINGSGRQRIFTDLFRVCPCKSAAKKIGTKKGAAAPRK